MVLARWQATIIDDLGNVQNAASVEVRHETGGAPLAVIYSDRDGLTPISNPITTGSDGFAAFHVAGGAYKITATKGAFSREWRYVGIGTAAENDIGAFAAASVIATDTIAERTIQDHLADLFSVKAFGAVGDGAFASPATDDTTAVTAANALPSAKFVPDGIYHTTLAASALDGPYWGRGQIRDADDHLRAPWFSWVKAAPASAGDENSVITAFDGDISHSFIQAEYRVTGAATLGQPTSGYLFTPHISPFRLYVYNESGHNESTTADDGRTSLGAHYINLAHFGRGDAQAYIARVLVAGSEPSGTSWPASPTGGAFHASVTAGADHVNLDPCEVTVVGNSFDVSGFGYIANLTRNENASARGEWWGNFLARSIGSDPVDVAYTVAGLYNHGLDLVHGTYTNNAAITLKQDDRIYFEAVADASGASRFPSALGDTYISYASASSLVNLVVNNQSVVQAGAAKLLSPLSIHARGGTAIPAGGAAGQGFLLSSTTNFGIFFGSGLPTLQAAKGSLYLRSDGAANNRLFVNTDGGTTWTASTWA